MFDLQHLRLTGIDPKLMSTMLYTDAVHKKIVSSEPKDTNVIFQTSSWRACEDE